MKFSIVTPVLNRAATIRAAIESVARQIGEVDGVQHIVVDGGSDDGTLEILSDYPHLEVIHEPRRGIYVAMNRGLAAAVNETVGIVNSDDLLEAGALKQVAECFAAYPQAQVVAGRGLVERLDGRDRQVVRRVPHRGHRQQSWDLLFHGSTAINARFFRRALLAQHGPFDTDFPIAADRELLIRLRLAGVETLPSDAVLYRYLEHEGSATLNAQARHDTKMRQEHIAIARKYFAEGALPPSLGRRFRGWIAAEHARLVLAMLQDHDWRGALREARAGLAAAPLPFLALFLRRVFAELRWHRKRGEHQQQNGGSTVPR